MAAQKAALEQSTKFLNEEKDKLTKTKNKEDTLSKELSGSDGLETKLINKNKEIASGIDDGAEDSSKSLQKMIKRGIYSCEDYQNKGLTKITEKIKFGNEEKEITYCYYSECDGKLFFKNNFEEIAPPPTSSSYFSNPKEGCFSISLKHEANEKIIGKIKFSLKTKTWNSSPKIKKGALMITEFELHKNNKNSDKFENTFISLESSKNDQNWKIKEKKKWADSHKNRYTYDGLKNKFSGEFKKLEIWNVKEGHVLNGSGPKGDSLMRDMSKRYLNLFDKGSDLWDWSEGNIKSKEHFDGWNTKVWDYLVKVVTWNTFGVWQEIAL